MKKRIIYIIVVVVALVGIVGGAFIFKQPSFLFSQVKSTNNGKTVSYKGKDGVTALKLLEEKTDIKTSGTGKNAFVTSIDGVVANPTNQYWQLNVNGKSAMEGAGSVITKNSDTITWKLTSF